MRRSFLAGLGALVLGTGLAVTTVFGLVSAQTGTSGQSPASVNEPVVDYGE